MKPIVSFLTALAFVQSLLFAFEAVADDDKPAPFITEAYYRIQWGHFDEFMELFKKNHYPILKELQKQGLIDSLVATFPVNHASEESRWDFRMTIAISDVESFAKAMPGISKKLYPDQEKLQEAERHRFSLLKAHTDIVVQTQDLSQW